MPLKTFLLEIMELIEKLEKIKKNIQEHGVVERHVSEFWRFEEGSHISIFYRTNILSKTFLPYCSHDCAKTFPLTYELLRCLVLYKNTFL